MDVAKAADVDWLEYFKSIRTECPWSYQDYVKGLIDIVEYQGEVMPLGSYSARVYVINASTDTVEALCHGLNHGEDEWLFSYPGYGSWATPVSVLIQQDRQRLSTLRKQLGEEQPR